MHYTWRSHAVEPNYAGICILDTTYWCVNYMMYTMHMIICKCCHDTITKTPFSRGMC